MTPARSSSCSLPLNELAVNEMLAGQLTDAAALVEEDRMVADITGNPPVGYAAMLLAALRGADERHRG